MARGLCGGLRVFLVASTASETLITIGSESVKIISDLPLSRTAAVSVPARPPGWAQHTAQLNRNGPFSFAVKCATMAPVRQYCRRPLLIMQPLGDTAVDGPAAATPGGRRADGGRRAAGGGRR